MKDIDTLESQFKTELRAALRRAANGHGSKIFSLNENRARSTAHRLRTKAERIMELRQSYSVDRSMVPPAARYLAACLQWEHGSKTESRSAQKLAESLLRELDR